MHINKIVDALRLGQRDEAPNERGNTIVRRWHSDAERYLVDFAEGFTEEGWLQFDTDQDAHYFGIWVNPRKLLTLAYCEGDWSLVECPTTASYNAEVRSMCEFYGAGFIAKLIDESGLTTIQQDRERCGFFAD